MIELVDTGQALAYWRNNTNRENLDFQQSPPVHGYMLQVLALKQPYHSTVATL